MKLTKQIFSALLIAGLFWAASLSDLYAQSTTALQSYYDELGQLVTVVYPTGDVVRYTYDSVGNITSITKTTLGSPGAVAIFNLLPSRGVPGTSVTIQGQGFDTVAANNTVQFNGVAAMVISASATALQVAVPPAATSGPVSVAVGSSTAQGPNFTVIHLTSLAVVPSTASLTPTNTFQFAASGVFDDASSADVTGVVTWTSSNTAVASISNVAGSQGLATGAGLGTTTITATSGSLTATAQLKVAPSGIVSLTVTPATTSVRQGQTTPFSAAAGFLTGPSQDVTGSTFWSSSNTNVATISNAPTNAGIATGVAPGTISITATATGLSGSAQLVVLPPTTTGAVPRFAYQANPDGTISTFIVDPVTGHLSGRGYAAVPLAALPNSVAMALDPQNRFLFYGVADSVNPSSSVFTFTIDSASGTLTLQPGSVTSPGRAWAVVEDPTGHFLYVGSINNTTGAVGISAYSINSNSGALTQVAGSPFATGPFIQLPQMAVDPSGRFLYADGSAGVFAFTIDPLTGALAPIAGSPFAADNTPQSITVDAKGKFVYVANNGSSTISAFAINATSGALTAVPGSPFATGSGFPVSISLNPSSTFAYVATTGISQFLIFGYAIDPATGALTPLAGSPFNTGNLLPSWISVDPSGAFLYQATTAGTIQAFTIAPGTGALTTAGSTSVRNTLNASVQLEISSGTTPVTLAPQFVLVANSGSNNVSAYTISPTSGALVAVSGSPFAAGTSPTSVSTDLPGRFAFVANNGSNNISAFGINPTTGALSPVTGSPFTAGTGPQSVAVDNSSEFVYVGNSGSQNISEFSLNPTTGALSVISGSPVGTSFNLTDLSSDPTGQLIFAAGTQTNFGMLNIYNVNFNQIPFPAANGSLQNSGSATGAGLQLKTSSVAVHPFARFAYAANMGSDNLTGFSFAPNGTIPLPGSPFATGTMPTGVAIDPSGRFVYVANSGSNNVSGFSIDSTTGATTPMSASPFPAGTNPSAVAVDGSGKFLLVTNKGDNSVSVFAIDGNTGGLTAVTGSPFATGTAPLAITVINKLQ